MNGGIKEQKIYVLFSIIVYVYIVSNINLSACIFLAELRGIGRNFGSYMRTTTMENSQGSYNHGEEFRGIHVSMRNVET